jgi:hypothetical protein
MSINPTESAACSLSHREEYGSENHHRWLRQMRFEADRIFAELFREIEPAPSLSQQIDATDRQS